MDYRQTDNKKEKNNIMNRVIIKVTAEFFRSTNYDGPREDSTSTHVKHAANSYQIRNKLVSSTQQTHVKHTASSCRARVEPRHDRLYSTRDTSILEHRAQ